MHACMRACVQRAAGLNTHTHTHTDECLMPVGGVFCSWGNSRGFSETHISPANFILPMFVHDGACRRLLSLPPLACRVSACGYAGLFAPSSTPTRYSSLSG